VGTECRDGRRIAGAGGDTGHVALGCIGAGAGAGDAVGTGFGLSLKLLRRLRPRHDHDKLRRGACPPDDEAMLRLGTDALRILTPWLVSWGSYSVGGPGRSPPI